MSPEPSAIVVLVLLIGRAAAAGAEEALAQVPVSRARILAKHGGAGAALLRLKLDPEASAAALRAAHVANLCLAVALAAIAGSHLLAAWSVGTAVAPPAWAAAAVPVAGGLLAAAFATVFDLVARAFANASPEHWALRLARPLRLITVLLGPVLRVTAAAIDVLLRPFGVRARFAPPRPPLEALEELLALEAGRRLDPSSPRMIRSIFEFSEKSARDIMVPRANVVAIDLSTPPAEVVRILAEEGHSRVPVYRESIDHVVGVLHTRDMVPLLSHPELIVLADVLRPAYFVPWATRIGDLLRQMQREKTHLAIVVDEHGGLTGVVTVDDILSEIVGDIPSESVAADDRAGEVETLADGTFVVRGDMGVPSFNAAFGVEIPEGPYETLGGYLNALAGAIPDTGSKFFFSGLQFTVTERTPQRLVKVGVARVKAPVPARTASGEAPAARG